MSSPHTFAALALVSSLLGCGAAPTVSSSEAARAECRAADLGGACELIGTAPEPWRQPGLDGTMLSVPPALKAPALVDFWSVDCVPCRQAMPELQALNRDRGVPVVGVSIDDHPGRVVATLRDRGITYPVITDDRRALAGQYRVGGDVPRLFVIDAAGIVRAVFGGAPDAVARAAALHAALSAGAR